MNGFWKSIGAAGHVIAAATKRVGCKKQAKNKCAAHSSSFSANFTAFAAGTRRLSAADQNHHAPEVEGSACGAEIWSDVSPAELMLLGAASSAVMLKPADEHALVISGESADPSSNAHAVTVVP